MILAKLYNAVLFHQLVLVLLTKVIFKPQLKDKMQSNDDVNNCRPISIVPILLKLFESYLVDFLYHI